MTGTYQSVARFGRTSSGPLRRTLALARPAPMRLVLASVLGASATASAIALLATSAWLISRAAQHPNEQQLAIAVVAVQFFGLARGFLRYGERLVGHDAAFRALADLRVTIYRRLERLAPMGLPAFRNGDLLARLVDDVDTLQDLMVRVLPAYSGVLLVGAGIVGITWAILPAAGVVVLLSLVVASVCIPRLTGLLSRRRAARQASVRGELSTAVVDLIDGVSELVVYGAVARQVEVINARDRTLTTIAASAAGTTGIGIAFATLLAGLAAWAALMVGVPAVHSGRLSGVLLAVIALVPLAAFELMAALPAASQSLEGVKTSATRVFQAMDAPPPVEEPRFAPRVPSGPCCIALHAVRARYPGRNELALDGVDLLLAPGRRVAIVGSSGAGKSTLAAVLLRFLEYEGHAKLNGIELRDLAGDDVRRVIGLVSQGAHMFDSTVAANLRLARPTATDGELGDVLDRVGLSHWLECLPDGLNTQVGRNGVRLSGGQHQRLAVARALLGAFRVLILDEPVEHLDALAADSLTRDLLAFDEGRSIVMISHRLAGLEDVDEILVMDQGRVIERGTHAALMDSGDRYRELWWEEMRRDRYSMWSEAEPLTASLRQETASHCAGAS